MKELLIALGILVPTIGASVIVGISIFFASTKADEFYYWLKSTTLFINISEASTVIILGYLIVGDLIKNKFCIQIIIDASIAIIGLAAIIFFIEYLRKYTYRKFSLEWFKKI